jgi:hypothetical protein
MNDASRDTLHEERAFGRFPYRFSPDGLLRRHIAIDVPAFSLADFEEVLVIAFKIDRFSRCRREIRRRRT